LATPSWTTSFQVALIFPAGRVGQDAVLGLVQLVLRLARTQLQQLGLSLVQGLLDLEADVKLLGNGLVGPARSTVVVDPLKTDEESARH
jgi:hypothetical protein